MSSNDLGLRRDEIFEARQIRDGVQIGHRYCPAFRENSLYAPKSPREAHTADLAFFGTWLSKGLAKGKIGGS